MARLFVGNFDFEHQLKGHAFTLPDRLRRRNTELSFLWIVLAADGDFILTDAKPDARFVETLPCRGLPRVNFVTPRETLPGGLELCPWGWSRELRKWGEQRGFVIDAPNHDAVYRANSRRFSFARECELGVLLPRADEFVDVDAVRKHLHDACGPEARWVIKAEFGMSARERILGQGTSLTPNDVNWMQRRVSGGQHLYFEPWVEKIAEAGLQFSIPSIGPPEFIGCTELLTDARGQYRGSRCSEHLADEWASEIAICRRVAEEMQRQGYFGPVGIDAMKYRDVDGMVRSRPIQDVNARWTMGRLAYSCRRLTPAGCCFSLLHLAVPDAGTTIPDDGCLPLIPEFLTWESGRRERSLNQVYLVWAETTDALKTREELLTHVGQTRHFTDRSW